MYLNCLLCLKNIFKGQILPINQSIVTHIDLQIIYIRKYIRKAYT